MAKYIAADLTSLTSNEASAVSTINSNFAGVETALENTLSRDGTSPNTMNADIDMNGNDLPNVGTVYASHLVLGGTEVVNLAALTSPTGEMAWTPPTTSSLPFQRTGASGTISNMSNARGVRITGIGTTTNSNELIYAMTTITSGAGGWQATGRFRRHSPMNAWGMTGMVVRNNANGRSETMSLGVDSVYGFNYNTFSADTSWASVAGAVNWYDHDFWMKIAETGGFRRWYVSKDGDAWVQIGITTVASSYVNAATHVGFHLNPNYGFTGNQQSIVHSYDCLSWSQTAL